ncbi:electron transport complex subunit RsxG, partial [Escherichia coli]|nr:electron transport complex subunit RsxG [Escherichia coli]
MLKTIRKHGITLALFAAGSTGLTAAINQMTKTTIAEQASLQQEALFDQVLPAERYNNALAQSCYLVTAPELGKGEHRVYIAKQDDKPVAAVLEATAPDGYSGAIQLLVGADFNGTVLGTRVTGPTESPGLGEKTNPPFLRETPLLGGKKKGGG